MLLDGENRSHDPTSGHGPLPTCHGAGSLGGAGDLGTPWVTVGVGKEVPGSKPTLATGGRPAPAGQGAPLLR